MTKIAAGVYEVASEHDAEERFRVENLKGSGFADPERPWVVTNASVGGSWGRYPVGEFRTLADVKRYFHLDRKAA